MRLGWIGVVVLVGCGSAESDDGSGGGDATGAGTTSGAGAGSGTSMTSGGSTTGGSTTTGGGGGDSPVAVWFATDFDDLDANGSNLYDFVNRYPQSPETWETDHTTDGGWQGSGAAHVVIHGCDASSPTCNSSENQFNAGWTTPPLPIAPSIGDRAFIRFRIKFDPGATFPIEGFGSKFMLMGTTGTVPNSRWIIHLFPPLANQGCTLGFDYSFMGWAPPASTWVEASDWGFGSNFDQQPIAGRYASFQSNVNISWSCNPGVLVTASDHAAPVPPPQSVGAAPQDGWYHLQFEAVSGNDGEADFRSWANNNDPSSPSSEHLDMPEGLGVEGWANGVDVGGYWGVEAIPGFGFIIDDFEVGPEFDPSWAP